MYSGIPSDFDMSIINQPGNHILNKGRYKPLPPPPPTPPLLPSLWMRSSQNRSHIRSGPMSRKYGSGVPTLCLQPKQRADITSIDQWCSVFNISMTINLKKCHTQAQAILKYSETVRHIERGDEEILSPLMKMSKFRGKTTTLHGTAWILNNAY